MSFTCLVGRILRIFHVLIFWLLGICCVQIYGILGVLQTGCSQKMTLSQSTLMKSRIPLLGLLLLGCPLLAYEGLDRLRFQLLSLKDGLSQSTVYSVTQDTQGFIWIGTQEGLNRYDGYAFKVYRRSFDKPNSLAHNYVRALAVDSQGNLWVGNDEALQQLKPETDSFVTFRHFDENEVYKQDYIIHGVWVDSLDRIWILTRDQILRHLDPQTRELTHFTEMVSGQGSDLSVTSVFVDTDGSILIGTRSAGLFQVDPASLQAKHLLNPKLQQDQRAITAVNRSAEGDLWLGVDHWIYGLDEDYRVNFRLTLPTSNHSVDPKTRVIQFDDRGRLLLGTFYSGLYHLDPATGSFQHYKEDLDSKFGLVSSEIFAIIRDQGGLYWLGTYAGLAKLDLNQTSFRVLTQATGTVNGLDHPTTFSIFEEEQGDLWVGTQTGLNRIDPDSQEFQVFQHSAEDPTSLGSGRVRSILVDRENRMWVGTQGGGLNLFNRSTRSFIRITNDPADETSLIDDRVRFIYEDLNGRLWVGTLGGLARKAPNRFAIVNYVHDPDNPTSLSFNRVLCLVDDTRNGLWVGTTRGLNLLKGEGAFRRFFTDATRSGSLTDNSISAFHMDSEGILYIGTLGGGVNILDTRVLDNQPPVFKHVTTDEGLPNNVINGLLPDEEGNIWISTNFGIARFNPKTYQVKTYDPADGLQGFEFNVGAYALGTHGELYFGGIDGMNIIIPEEVTNMDYRPPLVITSYRKIKDDGRMVPINSWVRDVTMQPEDRLLQMNFSALDYSAPVKNQYAYRLDNGAWIYLGNRNDLTIPILGSGSYQLQIKGSNHDGVWNEEGISVDIHIPPPFWQTPLAYVFYGVLLIGFVLLMHFGRLRAIQNRQRELELVVSERTKQLRYTKQELLDAAHKAGMAEMATNVLHDIGNSMNTVNTSVNMIEESLVSNKTLALLNKLSVLLPKDQSALRSFLTEDKHGRAFPSTFRKLMTRLLNLESRMSRELGCLRDEVNRIVTVIRAQEKMTHMKEGVDEIQLLQFLEDVVESLADRLSQFDFELDCPDDDALTLKVPRNRLQRVLINLIENACDAIEDRQVDGRIVLRLDGDQSEWVKLEVIDNGVGIQEEDMKKIFTQGFSTKNNADGYGLHYSANTVKEMKGRLLVHSDGINQGTTFTLLLPKPVH
jgi:ligand-binding sensor domain-containing protein/signal transduction histidine kinase